MDIDNRKYPRFCPKDMSACISITPPPPKSEIILAGTVINMSYTGIKIKLDLPFNEDIQSSVIFITLTLPESGIPITIKGIIRHLNDNLEYGLQYCNTPSSSSFNDLMFECVKIADNQDQANLALESYSKNNN